MIQLLPVGFVIFVAGGVVPESFRFRSRHGVRVVADRGVGSSGRTGEPGQARFDKLPVLYRCGHCRTERESKVLLYFYFYFPSPVLFLFFSMLFSGGKARLAIGCLYREMGTWVPYVLGMGPTHDESGLVRWDRMGLSLPWPVVLGGHGSFQVPKPAKMFELIFYVI